MGILIKIHKIPIRPTGCKNRTSSSQRCERMGDGEINKEKAEFQRRPWTLLHTVDMRNLGGSLTPARFRTSKIPFVFHFCSGYYNNLVFFCHVGAFCQEPLAHRLGLRYRLPCGSRENSLWPFLGLPLTPPRGYRSWMAGPWPHRCFGPSSDTA